MTTDRTSPARSAAPPDRSGGAPSERRDGSAFAQLLGAQGPAPRTAPDRRDAPRDDRVAARDDRPARNDDRPDGLDGREEPTVVGDDRVFEGDRPVTTADGPVATGRPVRTVLPGLPPGPGAEIPVVPAGQPALIPVTVAPAVAVIAAPPVVPATVVPAAAEAVPAAPATSAPAVPPAADGKPQAAAPLPATTAPAPAATPTQPSSPQSPTTQTTEPGVPETPAAGPTVTEPAPAKPAARAVQAPAEPARTATASQAPQADAAPEASTPAPIAPAATTERAAPLHRAPAAVATLLHVAAERGITRARMSLKPAELGGIEIRLQSTAAGVAAQVVADSPEAARLLAHAADDLRRALEARDVTLLSLEVSTSAEQQQRDGARARDGLSDPFAPSARGRDVGAAEEAAPDPTSTSVIELPGGLLVDVLA